MICFFGPSKYTYTRQLKIRFFTVIGSGSYLFGLFFAGFALLYIYMCVCATVTATAPAVTVVEGGHGSRGELLPVEF